MKEQQSNKPTKKAHTHTHTRARTHSPTQRKGASEQASRDVEERALGELRRADAHFSYPQAARKNTQKNKITKTIIIIN